MIRPSRRRPLHRIGDGCPSVTLELPMRAWPVEGPGRFRVLLSAGRAPVGRSSVGLLERDAELGALDRAFASAANGRGSTVLVLGEPGIGKTSLVQSWLQGLPAGARRLWGGCEDLRMPRALGPLRDAAVDPGPLAKALADDTDPGIVLPAVLAELGTPPSPTVLVLEDLHWADGATLDVVRYLGRRIETLPAVLVLTYRDDAVLVGHPLRAVLGELTGPATVRLRLAPLSASAVGTLSADAGVDFPELHRTTGGNPFYVTEVLATPDVEMPPTVVDAVLGRVGLLDERARTAVERCAVVPNGVEMALLRALQPDLGPVAEAERQGILTLRGQRMSFRHELARRVVAASLPAGTRVTLHLEVLGCLLDDPEPDPFRVLHHAVAAAADDVVLEYGRRAAREAHAAGAFEQEAACYAEVVERADGLPPAERAGLLEAYAWALSTSNHPLAAAQVAHEAVEQWQEVGDEARAVGALVVLSRQQFLTEQTEASLESARQALHQASSEGDTVGHALARVNLGAALVVADREVEGLEVLTAAMPLVERVQSPGVHSLARTYVGSAHLQLGRPEGRDELLAALRLARRHDSHEAVMRAYYNLVEGCWRLGHVDEALDYVDQAEAYERDRELHVYTYMIEARRLRGLALHGRWQEAIAGLREMVDGRSDPGMIGRETIPALARLLVRTGDPEADRLVAVAQRHAERADVLEWLVPTGLAVIEWAWLAGRPELAGDHPRVLLERTDRPGMSWQRAELLRYLARSGRPVPEESGLPAPYAIGLAGDWELAAAEWEKLGDPYERALELAESGDVEATVEAYRVLDSLGAVPALRLARARLRQLGVTRVPRRLGEETRSNAAGLTARQLEIARLLADGLTNAEIGSLLVLSTRTVDHHVASVFTKLDVHSRRDAVARIRSLGLS
jgi:DNA-binding CsgD family transcriptional regulator/tetratricopeptide (TPR) repeat protein